MNRNNVLKAELSARTAEFKAICNVSMDGIILLSSDGDILEANLAMTEILGFSREELIATNISSLSSDQQLVGAALSDVSNGNVSCIEVKLENSEGRNIPIEIKIKRIHWDEIYRDHPETLILVSNSQSVIFAIIRDISRLLRIEEDLLETNARLETLIEAIPDPIFMKDGGGRWLITNSAAKTLFDLYGKNWENKTDAELAMLNPHLKDAHEYCIASDEETWSATMRRCIIEKLQAPGGERVFEVIKVPIFDSNGKRRNLVAVGRETTRLVKAEKDARDFASRLKIILDNAPIGIAHIVDSQIVWTNRRMCLMFGYSTLANVSMTELFPDGAFTSIRGRCTYDFSMKGQFVAELNMQRGDHHPIWCRVSAQQIDGKRPQEGSIWIFQDVTEQLNIRAARKDHQRKVRELTAKLESERDKQRESIARDIHDELGGTLTALKMRSSLLADSNVLDETLHSQLSSITNLCDDALKTVRRIAGSLRYNLPTDVSCHEAITMYCTQFCGQFSLDFSLNFNGEIILSRERLSEIVNILRESITNIAKHAHASHVQIRFSSNQAGVELRVSDDGIGIDPLSIRADDSYGIKGMIERIELLGGHLSIIRNGTGGTEVNAWMPREIGKEKNGRQYCD